MGACKEKRIWVDYHTVYFDKPACYTDSRHVTNLPLTQYVRADFYDKLREMLGAEICARIDAFTTTEPAGATLMSQTLGNSCNVEDGLTEWCRGCGKLKNIHPFYPYNTAERLIVSK